MSPFVTILKIVDHPLETKETVVLHCISRAAFLSRGQGDHREKGTHMTYVKDGVRKELGTEGMVRLTPSK